MRVLVLNGPNINLLGKREPEIYGTMTYQVLCDKIASYGASKYVNIEIKQSNHEGVLIDLIQEADGMYDAIVINAAGYTHTSVAIMDAIKAITIPCVEVHLSDPSQREKYRQYSFLKEVCVKTFKGEKELSYLKAIEYLNNNYAPF